jgi:glycosyltransferase involved in cell wall biosynthesis
MRVLVNHLTAVGRKTGIGHYADQLVRCLREQIGDGSIDCFAPGWYQQVQDAWEWAGARFRRRPPGPVGGPGGLKSRLIGWVRQAALHATAWHFRRTARRGRYDLYHEPNYVPLPCDLPTVATILDLSVLLYPEWHPADRVAHFERYFHRGLGRCAHFLTISESGRQEIIRTLGIAPERITCAYVGVRPGLGPLPREEVEGTLRELGLPPRYLLYLGTIEPRKNVLRLLHAYCSLPAAVRDEWPLVLVGGWGWNSADVAEYLHGEARHRGVLHLGYAAERHVAAIYNGARALVYPSVYEGFGLPPVEMMACGGAVLASTAAALVETVGSRAHLVAPEDTDGWRDALLRVVRDDEWWHSLRRGVEEVARPFTWDRCAADTLRVYRAVCGLPAEPSHPVRGLPARLKAAG